MVGDAYFDNRPVDVPLDLILGKPPKMTRDVQHVPQRLRAVVAKQQEPAVPSAGQRRREQAAARDQVQPQRSEVFGGSPR